MQSHWEDKLAIRDLLERYMRYNDDGALDLVVGCFHEDGIYQVSGRILRGHGDLREFFSTGGSFIDNRPKWTEPGELYKQPRSVHICSNPIIEIDGDTARAESDFVVLTRDSGGHAKISLLGRYRDELRRDERGQWLIAKRTGVSAARPGEAYTDSGMAACVRPNE